MNCEISKLISNEWNNMEKSEKQVYINEAEKIKEVKNQFKIIYSIY